MLLLEGSTAIATSPPVRCNPRNPSKLNLTLLTTRMPALESPLVDSGDSKAGIRVVKRVKFNFDGFLGLQRTGGDVAIAVDPSNSSIVYVAYNDDDGADYMLHVLRSTNRGVTWSGDL